ncbi:hypothetical protein TspCOW1_22130 [Thiohalobacter sp. COW1]|uniref:Uncharacterized protein n=1 Tax=Thiohalobacter thiocyanaticus TaxID=585455 RepID=A0A1Z4VNK6_9GAMM|nr:MULTISPECIES: hypothetical protein [Thiohalobacter]BAZ92928.1 uncharacterized protein FOKN1_0524 [Thiohalobacter thiocyanaticus]BCO32110.1 hypothetical protein TspCOW1_22130 [Thiohalobacter sp. COW1]
MNLPRHAVFPLLEANEPLFKRAPSVDGDGQILSDFMMLIPGLREKPRQLLQRTLDDIQAVLACFQEVVVFAELNLKLNLLWISMRPVTGMRNEIAWAVQNRVPEAKLISHI